LHRLIEPLKLLTKRYYDNQGEIEPLDIQEIASDLDAIQFNEILKTTDTLNGKPLFMGSIVSNIATNPRTLETITTAQKNHAGNLLTQFKSAVKVLGALAGQKVNEITLVNEFSIDVLREYVNMAFSIDEIDETYRRGYLDGLGDRMSLMSRVEGVMPYVFILLALVMIIIYAYDSGMLGTNPNPAALIAPLIRGVFIAG